MINIENNKVIESFVEKVTERIAIAEKANSEAAANETKSNKSDRSGGCHNLHSERLHHQ